MNQGAMAVGMLLTLASGFVFGFSAFLLTFLAFIYGVTVYAPRPTR